MTKREWERAYRDLLASYFAHPSEATLYEAEVFSRNAIEEGISPEEVISFHKVVTKELVPHMTEETASSLDVLLEVMVAYGIVFGEYQALRERQLALKSEMEIAANVQQTLLETAVPDSEGIDIGAISVPARHMNGDYHHFVHDDDDCISVAIADVIGKGIPAALCMSMIKYAMDSLPENRPEPKFVLENLNRVVEQNVDPSMFVTMFYAMYNPDGHTFTFASAGHEPGFYYRAKEERFEDLNARGLMLGVERKTKYRQYVKSIEEGDMIILLSDGVTECRTEEGFIERDKIISIIEKYKDQPAQQLVESVYKELEKLQDFELRDDFTLIVLRRQVSES
nr:PP2C family protein-serine/threonine phosphatase [Bacillus fonticola]